MTLKVINTKSSIKIMQKPILKSCFLDLVFELLLCTYFIYDFASPPEICCILPMPLLLPPPPPPPIHCAAAACPTLASSAAAVTASSTFAVALSPHQPHHHRHCHHSKAHPGHVIIDAIINVLLMVLASTSLPSLSPLPFLSPLLFQLFPF
jgi:hypothetical protein